MKRKLFAICAVSVLAFTSCDDKESVVDTLPIELSGEMMGSIDRDANVKGDIRLNGATIVRSGATLTIPAICAKCPAISSTLIRLKSKI